jgi:hypothetical protein
MALAPRVLFALARPAPALRGAHDPPGLMACSSLRHTEAPSPNCGSWQDEEDAKEKEQEQAQFEVIKAKVMPCALFSARQD